jgi:hypothetical protein
MSWRRTISIASFTIHAPASSTTRPAARPLRSSIMPRLAKGLTVVAVDLPGVGKSGAAANGYDTAHMAAGIHALAAALDLERPYTSGRQIRKKRHYRAAVREESRLFYEDLDSIFKPKIAEAFNASLKKVGKIVLPTFTSARWTSPDEVEIKGESVVIINDDDGDKFTFTASVSNSGTVQHLTVVPKR